MNVFIKCLCSFIILIITTEEVVSQNVERTRSEHEKVTYLELFRNTAMARLNGKLNDDEAVEKIRELLDNSPQFGGHFSLFWELLLNCDLSLLEKRTGDAKTLLKETKFYLDELEESIPSMFEGPVEIDFVAYYNHLYEQYSNSVIKIERPKGTKGSEVPGLGQGKKENLD